MGAPSKTVGGTRFTEIKGHFIYSIVSCSGKPHLDSRCGGDGEVESGGWSPCNRQVVSHEWMLDSCAIISKAKPCRCRKASVPDEFNAFYAHSERENKDTPTQTPTISDNPVISLSEANIRASFKGMNPRKASSPDYVSDQALKACVEQLAGDLFSLSLLLSEVPAALNGHLSYQSPGRGWSPD